MDLKTTLKIILLGAIFGVCFIVLAFVLLEIFVPSPCENFIFQF